MIGLIKRIFRKIVRYSRYKEVDIYDVLNEGKAKYNYLLNKGKKNNRSIDLNLLFKNSYIFTVKFLRLFSNCISIEIVPISYVAMSNDLFIELRYNGIKSIEPTRLRLCRDYCETICFCTYTYKFKFNTAEKFDSKKDFSLDLKISDGCNINMMYSTTVQIGKKSTYLLEKNTRIVKLHFPYKQVGTQLIENFDIEESIQSLDESSPFFY